MPQPRYHHKGELVIGPAALVMQPKLAMLMASIIVEWALAESYTAMLFTTLLPGDKTIALEIYHGFFEPSHRSRIFLTVAKKRLSKELYARLEKHLEAVRGAAKDRHIVAHSLWCYSPSIPNCLCVIDQKVITADFIRMTDIVKRIRSSPPREDLVYGKNTKLTAYSEKDLQNMLARMQKLDEIGLALTMDFMLHLDPSLDD